jgi:hypothetical protein
MYDTDLSLPSSIARRRLIQLVSGIRRRPDGVTHELCNVLVVCAAKN